MRLTALWIPGLIPLLAVWPCNAASQGAASIEMRSEVHAVDGSRLKPWTTVTGAGALDRSWLSVAATASALTDGGRWDAQGRLATSVYAPPTGPFRLSVGATLDRAAERDSTAPWSAAGAARLSVRRGSWGLWTGVDARASSGADSIADRVSPSIGGWRQFGNTIVSLAFAPQRRRVDGASATIRQVMRRDSVYDDTLSRWNVFEYPVTVGDSGRSGRVLRWDQAEARLFWSSGRVAADATVGARFAAELADEFWGEVSGLVALTSRVVLVGSAGSRPGDPAHGWRRRNLATLGVRILGAGAPEPRLPAELRPGPADFQLARVRAGVYALTLVVPGARLVEVSGTFTEWTPLAMTPAGHGRWEAIVRLSPGTHHVNVRVDGDEWIAPPGLPQVEDEFNGTVGLLVVP